MDAIKTNCLDRISEIYTLTQHFIIALRSFEETKNALPNSAFFDYSNRPDILEQEKPKEDYILTDWTLKLKNLKDAGTSLVYLRDTEDSAYGILLDALAEMQENALKELGKDRRRAYTSKCMDALSWIKSSVLIIDQEWVSQNGRVWHSTKTYFRSLSKKKLTVFRQSHSNSTINKERAIRSLNTEFGSKIAFIAKQVEDEIEIKRRNLIRFINLMETVIKQYLGGYQLSLLNTKNAETTEYNQSQISTNSIYNDTFTNKEKPVGITLTDQSQAKKVDSRSLNNEMEMGVKLTWNASKNALYDLLWQLKNKKIQKGKKRGRPLIEESSEQIALFLIQHVNGFEDLSMATIRAAIRNYQSSSNMTKKPPQDSIQINITEKDSD